jgi:hypothetical protein
MHGERLSLRVSYTFEYVAFISKKAKVEEEEVIEEEEVAGTEEEE